MTGSPWREVFAVTVLHDDIQHLFHPAFCDFDHYAQRLHLHAIDSLRALPGVGQRVCAEWLFTGRHQFGQPHFGQ